MLNKRKVIGCATACALAIALAACGSSNDDDNVALPPAPPAPPAAVEIPASASTVAGFIAFLLSLANSATAEPIAVGTFTPPTDDTGEPLPL